MCADDVNTGNQFQSEEISKENNVIGNEIINSIPITISAILGRVTMPVNQVLKLRRGAVIELNRKIGESIDLYINEKLIARGEVIVVENSVGITLTEIIK